jgi:hypothetical protein
VSFSSLTIPAKSSRASTRMLPVIPEITEKIQTLHVKLKSSFAGIQTSFKTLETQLYEDTLFMEISESIDLAVKLGVVARDIKKLLDTFEDSISTSQPNIAPGTLPNDGMIEQTAESIEKAIRRQLQLLRTELECVTSLDEAVCLTRVIRTVKKVCLYPLHLPCLFLSFLAFSSVCSIPHFFWFPLERPSSIQKTPILFER